MFLIAGPCVIESESLVLDTFSELKEITSKFGIEYIAKSSFTKANRSSVNSFTGPGVDKGLQILQKAQKELDLKVITDVHDDTPLDEVASVVDVLQTPAFLVRQTSFIQKVASYGKPVNIKKGQWMHPADMAPVVEKCRAVGNNDIWLCDRGTSFGFGQLINYMPGLTIMKETGCKVVMDATHSVQMPGMLGGSTGGNRYHVPAIARAAVAVGVDGLFMETHPDPDKALCDGPNMIPLKHMEELLETLLEINEVVKKRPMVELKLK
ncbi:3-deoxy-8-phosphooctulonate synthase [Vibrio parahaemolyticus]|uniref:3-deoxy-8-phosphooctulonate synthase n=1 Tax=Vibrio parahaemolyticus TaxID=670 RepID=UPI0015C06083|nr:3-deoxy-8-phosphooctulonate synthase [Vibrio parahaemolyticus]MBE4326488.1 3-deoxy-8-phosphooctulonate synthase [Vibrio parahaemolyticus]QLE28633.1 3-deoxy-8-phosphooctulonate synthase [Vibrio parahaemolyticus]HCE1879350.1 3-deoxy-8-phosphooctulonate synthase [Vibrio parahaemolyticus]HCE3644026.1 3-deoxy-8-phosphooctulonate synthase [Vibrio parahaemolyticus]HCE4534416.1 3-deoxy-8-phosphooctulonate synthase [Vibrio parahaemolyticus]